MFGGGYENLTPDQIRHEIEQGGRFLVFQYCVSIVVMSFKRPSGVRFVRSGESALVAGLPFTLISLVFGWWGSPWGPIWSIATIVSNCRGGLDVTAEVAKALSARAA